MVHRQQPPTCAMDRWPVELIFMLFEYLSGTEIFASFYNTSTYLNSVLKCYTAYAFNFANVSRRRFDEILSHLDLSHIVSLTLSNGELTGGQVGLFLSRYSTSFHLFTSLHSFALHCVKMNNDEYSLLVAALKQWKGLRLLHLSQITLANVDDRFTTAFNQLDRHCLVTLDRCEQLNIIPLTDRLQSWRSSCLYDIDNSFYHHKWPCLRTVQLTNLWRTSINHLFQLTPQLLSLTVDCEIDRNTSSPNFQLAPNLRKLLFSCQNLNFDAFVKSTSLDRLSKLKHLEIRCSSSADHLVFDGQHWERFLSTAFPRLVTFDFRIKSSHQQDVSLATFRTRFWLEEKRWFVAISHCPYSNHLEVFTVPRFNTTMKISRAIVDSTSPSFEHLSGRVHVFDSGSLVDKNNNDTFSLSCHRYSHIERFEFLVQDKFDSMPSLIYRLNRVLDFNTIKTVQFDVLRGWIVNYQQIFDLLEHMPNLSKVILDTWPKKDCWLQIKKRNSRVIAIELPLLHRVSDGRLPSGLQPIFSHLFHAVEHVHMRVHDPELCYQFDCSTLPWTRLSSLQIKYFFSCHTHNDADEERRYKEWKEKLLGEVLPQQARRNFTYTDVDNKLCIWFGEVIHIKEKNGIEEIPVKRKQKKTTTCFSYRNCVLS